MTSFNRYILLLDQFGLPSLAKKPKESNVKYDQTLSVKQLISSDLHETVKGRFASFCTAVGIQTLMTIMNQDVEAVAEPKGKHNLNRTAYRHGFQATTILMVNQRLAIERLKVRSIDTNQELPILNYETFANDDQLLKAALNRMLYGISARDYVHGIED